MKKIAASFLLTATMLMSCSCGDAGLPAITQNTTAEITWVDNSGEVETGKMKFSFNLGCDCTKIILTVDGGALVTESDAEQTEKTELTLFKTDSFYWIPGEGTQEHAVIVIQICDKSKTLHCGTISLIKNYDEKTDTTSYKAVLDSDDGLNIRQGYGSASVIIHAE